MRQQVPITPTVIFDSGCRVVKAGQLHAIECGWLMTPAQVGRHLLVYRCDVQRCGRHTADITDIDAGLLREYRAWRLKFTALDAYTRPEQEVVVEAYKSLLDAWAQGGHLHQAQFASVAT